MTISKTMATFMSLLLTTGSAQGALRFGLGNAVAKGSADLITTASNNDPVNAVGYGVVGILPSCSSGALYDSPPTNLGMIGGIDPLGHVNPSAHTFPSDHIYFYSSTSTVQTPAVYAPGSVHITSIGSTDYLTAVPPFSDYTVTFYPCRDVKSYYGHVRTLSPSLLSKVGSIDQNCFTYSTGGGTYRACRKDVNIVLNSGDAIGAVATSGTLDFGTYDYRITPLAFANPSRHFGDQPYTVCPIDYFTPGPTAAMQSLLGRYDGGYRRSTAPICGQTNYDLPGTARGYWYHPGAPDVPEDPHLSLIVNNVYAPQQTISIGTSVPNQTANFYTFTAVSSGQVDRDFADVKPDGLIYCYDTFYDPIGQLGAGSAKILIQMLNANTLKVESQPPLTCGGGGWAFTSNAVTFER